MANRIFYTIFNLIFKNYTISYELRSSWTNQTFLWRIKEISPNLRLIIYFSSCYSVAASTSQRDFFPASNFDQNQNPVRRVLTSHFFVSIFCIVGCGSDTALYASLKLLLITYKYLNDLAPMYINELWHYYTPCPLSSFSDSNLSLSLRLLQFLTEIDLLR